MLALYLYVCTNVLNECLIERNDSKLLLWGVLDMVGQKSLQDSSKLMRAVTEVAYAGLAGSVFVCRWPEFVSS